MPNTEKEIRDSFEFIQLNPKWKKCDPLWIFQGAAKMHKQKMGIHVKHIPQNIETERASFEALYAVPKI